MFLQYRDLKLIQTNNRPDQDNKDILVGKYDNSETPLSYEERMAKIFSDWQQGDILVIADQPLKYPKKQGDTLVEMTREEVCDSGDLSVLEIGEVYQDGKIIKKEPSDDLFKPKWEYPNWVESMPQEEQEEYHNKLIDALKTELLEDGFVYNDKTKTSHQQKCRDKDLSYLGNAIASMTDASIPTMKWYFNNGDMLELSLEDMKGLRANGAILLSVVFGIEAQIKSEQPTKNITLEMFKDKVDAISQVKCWRA